MIPDLKILPVSHPVDGSSALCLTPCPSQEGEKEKRGEGGGRKWREKERGISFAVSLLIPAAVFTAGVHGARPVWNVCRPGLF